MTTERTHPPQARAAVPRRTGLSVRTRITATVALMVFTVLAVAGAIVFLVEAHRLHEASIADVDRVLDEFRQEARESESRTLDQLLRGFLSEEVATGDQSFAAIDADTGRVFGTGHDTVVTDPGFADLVRGIARDGGSVRTRSHGRPLLITAQPVRLDGRSGAFLVISDFSDNRRYLGDTVRTYVLVSAGSFLLVVGVAFWQSGRLLRPLRDVRETAEEISHTDLSRRIPVRGNDDLTALTNTFNTMLDRLEEAFTDQRRFLDDAGHELKTPLTVLQGHLELLDPADEQEVAQTRDLLLDETDRMARLVGDLILLAKSNRPGFVVPRDVDLAPLVETVLAKARALGERSWLLDGAAERQVRLDEQRITQALLQLADNAVAHTVPGDTIAVGATVTSTAAVLWVRDTGSGVPPEEQTRIFERFGRGRDADDEGFGLGLSIVSAIAEAHAGTVRLDPAYADGARFELVLPLDGGAVEV